MTQVAKSTETPITVVQEGESGRRTGVLTQERIEVLGDYFSRSAEERATIPLRQLALITGLSDAAIRHAQRDKRVLARVREQADIEATYDAIEARAFIRATIQAVKEGKAPWTEGLKAARTQLELSGDLKKAGASVNVVNQNITPTSFMDMPDDVFLEQFDRAMKERGVDPED